MSSDAYAPPEARLTEARSGTEKVYSLNQVAVAALLGTPLAALWLMRKNYQVFGNDRGQRRALVWGVLSLLAFVGVSLLLPDKVPNAVVATACTFPLREIAKRLQGARVEDHLVAGRKHSWWRVIGISLVCTVLLLAAEVPIVLLISGGVAPK